MGMQTFAPSRHRAALSVVLIALIIGCSKGMPTEVSDDTTVALRVNKPVSIEDKSIVMNVVRIENDSRCPTDVSCVSAGNAVVVFTAEFGNLPVIPAEQFVNTTIEPRSATVGSYAFRLDSLTPRPISTATIAQSQYVAHMTVSAAK